MRGIKYKTLKNYSELKKNMILLSFLHFCQFLGCWVLMAVDKIKPQRFSMFLFSSWAFQATGPDKKRAPTRNSRI